MYNNNAVVYPEKNGVLKDVNIDLLAHQGGFISY